MSRRRQAVVDAAVALTLSLAVLAPFALRHGIPALHHDWLWPSDRLGFWLRFVQNYSTWNPFGLGGDLDAPSVNYLSLLCWALSQLGFSAQWVLLLFLAAIFSIGQWGMSALFSVGKLGLPRFERSALSFAYAFGPVCFQKLAAGQLYFVAAYELLPLFVALVWLAVTGNRRPWRYAVMAGLLLSVMETQIQFLLFGLICAAIAGFAVRERRPGIILQLAIVAALPLLHAITLFANIGGNETAGLVSAHATGQWEIDMSGRFSQLVQLGGYEAYDRAALHGLVLHAYDFARLGFVFSACIGLFFGLMVRRTRSIAIFALAVALFALLWANGWYGPFAAPMNYAMHATILFTIVRELYHVMALYAIGVVILAAVAASLTKRAVSRSIAVLAILTALPYLTAGENGLIPAIPAAFAATGQCRNVSNMCALFPMQQPVGLVSKALAMGSDPATLVPQSGNPANAPVFISYAIDRFAMGDARALRAMGFERASWRPNFVSRLPQVFEPHVGAKFADFLALQRRLQTRLKAGALSLGGSPVLYIEPRRITSVLDASVADGQLPTGLPAFFTSSFENNNVEESWVSGSLWAWQFPRLMNLAVAPVVSTSDSVLPIQARTPHQPWLYVLASGDRPLLDHRVPDRIGRANGGSYRWFVWHVAQSEARFGLRFQGPVNSVARAILSDDARWLPSEAHISESPQLKVDAVSGWPWKLSGTIPYIGENERLVFGRSFSHGWHLYIDGVDLGGPQRVHGLFNAWPIDPRVGGHPFILERVDQARANLLNALDVLISLGMLVIFITFQPRAAKMPINQ